MKVFIYTDGGIDKMKGKGQPTQMYGGVIIKEIVEDHVVKTLEFPFKFGMGTSNQAEFLAFIHGIDKFLDCYDINTPVCFFSDSKLLVEIINGNWLCANPDLKVLCEKAMERLDKMNYRIQWVPRERNTAADNMTRVLR